MSVLGMINDMRKEFLRENGTLPTMVQLSPEMGFKLLDEEKDKLPNFDEEEVLGIIMRRDNSELVKFMIDVRLFGIELRINEILMT